jgi:hypothetical protein
VEAWSNNPNGSELGFDMAEVAVGRAGVFDFFGGEVS